MPMLDRVVLRDLAPKGTAVATEAQGLILLDVWTSARQHSLLATTTVKSACRPAKIGYLPLTRPAVIAEMILTRSHPLDPAATVQAEVSTLGLRHPVVGGSSSNPLPHDRLRRIRITAVSTRTLCHRALLIRATVASMLQMRPLGLVAEVGPVVAGTSPARSLSLPSASAVPLWDLMLIEGVIGTRSTTALQRHRVTALTRRAFIPTA